MKKEMKEERKEKSEINEMNEWMNEIVFEVKIQIIIFLFYLDNLRDHKNVTYSALVSLSYYYFQLKLS